MGEKKSRSSSSESKKSKEDVTAKVKVPEEAKPPKEPPKPKAPPKPRGPMVTFTRWFNARGFRPHWKAGMAVHAGNTKMRRTPEEWDKLFENY
jgi:hypothetical protein